MTLTQLHYAAWVQPIAEEMRHNRREIIALAQSLPIDVWSRPSPNPGWTYRDLLAHIADDTGKNLHAALDAVTRGHAIPAELFADIDARNARGIRDRGPRSIEQLVDEIQHDGNALEQLLSRVRDDDEDKTQPELKSTFGDFLRNGLAAHDALHLEQLRTAMAG